MTYTTYTTLKSVHSPAGRYSLNSQRWARALGLEGAQFFATAPAVEGGKQWETQNQSESVFVYVV